MFRGVWVAAIAAMVAFDALALATAEEPKLPGGKIKGPPKELAVDIGKGVKLEMVLIPAGEFLMGSYDSDKNALANEKPQHKVWITKPFYVGKYPVTQEQWEAIMGYNPSQFHGAKNPVEMVSWFKCQKFLDTLNTKAVGQAGKFVLPTEAQWEYACRAGSTARYSFGDDGSKLGDYEWYGANAGGSTHPVGQKKPNAWGLYDMQGNVSEWCQDRFDAGYYARSPVDDPSGPSYNRDGECRVIRGGSISAPKGVCRSARRGHATPWIGSGCGGFRVCLIPNTGREPERKEP